MALQTKTYTKSSNTYTLELTVVEQSISTAGNTSTISYTLKLKSTTKNFAMYGVGAKTIFDGKTVGERNRDTAPKVTLNTRSEVTLLSGTTTVAHRDDGSKSMAVAFSLDMASASYTPGPMSGSDTMTLTQIPRGATITSASDFTDEGSPTVKYSNPGGADMELCIKSEDESKILVEYRGVTGSSYTFSFSQAERQSLQTYATKNTAMVVFVLRSVLAGKTYFSTVERTLTIKNPAPILDPTVEDTNPATLALTGDAGVMVRYQSNAQVSIGAEAVKGASLVSRSAACGSRTLTGDGLIIGVESGTFTFRAKDSRGNSTTKTVSKTLVEYLPPTCNIGQGQPTTQGTFDFVVSGAAFTSSFGQTDNTLTVEARYRIQGEESWGEWQPMEVRTGASNYTATLHITGLDYRLRYDFQARCADRLITTESQVATLSAIPQFAWSKKDFQFYIPVYIQGVKYVPDVQRNLLINPSFTVNQRGSSTYTIIKPTYTLDCWKTCGTTATGTVTAGQSYAEIANTAGTLGLGQFVEDYRRLAGKTVTLSVLADILSGSYRLGLNDGTEATGENVSVQGTQLYTFTHTMSATPSQLWCQFISQGAASCRIFGAKLEVGDHQTLAAQDKDGTWQLLEQPDPLEYLKCCRYQFVPWIGDNTFPMGFGFALGSTSARIMIPCPVEMRVEAPSVEFLQGSSIAGMSIFCDGTAKIPTAISGVKSTPTGIGVNFTTTGLVGNQSCILRRTDGKILFDANM